MKLIVRCVLVVLFAGLIGICIATCSQADESTSMERVIDNEIAHAIAEGNCVNLSKVNNSDVVQYFKQVFASEKEKQAWLDKILNHAKSHNRNLEVEVSIIPLELSLESEDTISIDNDGSGALYIFYRSGKMTCAKSYGSMSSGNFAFKNGHYGIFGPAN